MNSKTNEIDLNNLTQIISVIDGEVDLDNRTFWDISVKEGKDQAIQVFNISNEDAIKIPYTIIDKNKSILIEPEIIHLVGKALLGSLPKEMQKEIKQDLEQTKDKIDQALELIKQRDSSLENTKE